MWPMKRNGVSADPQGWSRKETSSDIISKSKKTDRSLHMPNAPDQSSPFTRQKTWKECTTDINIPCVDSFVQMISVLPRYQIEEPNSCCSEKHRDGGTLLAPHIISNARRVPSLSSYDNNSTCRRDLIAMINMVFWYQAFGRDDA